MRLPVLPVVDLLILLASVTFLAAIVSKLIAMAFLVHIYIEPMDLVSLSGVLLLFALALVGRDWLKANEPAVMAEKRASESLEAYKALRPDAVEEEPGAKAEAS